MPNFAPDVADIYMVLVLMAGTVLIWRFVLKPTPENRAPSALPRWEIEPLDFMLFLVCVFCGPVIMMVIGSAFLHARPMSADSKILFLGVVSQIGFLLGVVVFYAMCDRATTGRMRLDSRSIRAGVVTFLILLPIILVTSIAWQWLLEIRGVPVEKQELVELLMRIESPAMIAVLVIFATVVAPIAEELIFRAGLFRYLRTRVSRPTALIVPALLFAGMHYSVATFMPLFVLALIFSLAYERTGNIAVTIVAHGLFNLNTVVFILSGLPT